VADANLFQASDDHLLDALLQGGDIFLTIAQTVADDVQFKALQSCVCDGWPKKLLKRDVWRHVLQPYWSKRHEIRKLGPFLLYGSRVCAPHALHAAALQLLHRGHPGINFMLQRACNVFYWPGITADRFRHVAVCPECASTRPSLPPEPLLPTPTAKYPGELLAADFFDYNSKCYLACADAFSNFIFYCRVTSPSATVLIRACQQIFQHTGYPRVFASDGGPAFWAESFQDFLKACNCEHRVSSPRYAQSNGAAKRALQ
jgi:transposase InsO family protein